MFQIIGSHSGHQVCISLFGGPGAASTSKNRTLFSALGPKRGIEVVFKPQARILWEYYASRRFFHGGSLQLVKTIFFLSKKTQGPVSCSISLGLRLWFNDLGPKKPNHHYKTPKPSGKEEGAPNLIVFHGSLGPSWIIEIKNHWVTCEASPELFPFKIQATSLNPCLLATSLGSQT